MAASPGGVEVGRISVRVVPDTSRLGPDLKAALDKIEAATDLLISTSIDTTRLDEEARAAVEQAQLAAGDLDIKTEVDTSQVHEAETALGDASKAASGFSLGLGGIATAAIVLGPALIPIIALIAGLGAALVAPLAIAGGGLTVFGFLAGFAVKQTQAQLKNIDALKKKLAGLTVGTKSYKVAAAQLATAQAALTPAQAAFSKSLDGVKAAFNSIPKSVILAPITQGLNLLARVLPLLTPVIKAVSRVLTGLLGQLDKAASSAGFKAFIQAFAKQLGPDLKAFASIAANVFTGLFGLFGAFNKQLSGQVLKSLVNLTKRFADWGKQLGQSTGFKTFVAYLNKTGPKVAAALDNIAGALGHIIKAAAPIGGVVLTEIGNLAGAIKKIPADTLQKIVTALVVLVAAAKVTGPVTKLLSAFGLANPEILITIGVLALLGAGFIDLYKHSKATRQILSDLGDFFQKQLLPIIEQAARQVFPAISSAIHDISQSIKQNKPFLETFGKLLLVFAAAAVVTGILAIVGAIRVIGKVIGGTISAFHLLTDQVLLFVIFSLKAFALLTDGIFNSLGGIVAGAAKAFGWIPGLGPKIKAAEAEFESFRNGVVGSINGAAESVAAFKARIDAVASAHHKIHIDIDALVANKELTALQEFRIKDKSFKVTENFIERQSGQGGGIGIPGQSSTAVPPPATAGGTGGPHGGGNTDRSGNGITIQHQEIRANDYHDFLRQQGNAIRGRAGGGVDLLGASRS